MKTWGLGAGGWGLACPPKLARPDAERRRVRPAGRGPLFAALAITLAAAGRAAAGDHYALVITGASGGEQYAQKYDKWRTSFIATAREKLGYPSDHIVTLAEREGGGAAVATRENVVRELADFRKRLTKDDQLLIVLVGHGSSVDEEGARFNLVGPDLTAGEWADLVKAIPGRLVFVNTTSASFPFLRRLAGRGRIVLTATDNVAQVFETVFPEFFLKAFADPGADADKNGRVSVWEAFAYASTGVQQWFEQRGRLPTERALLDDTGTGTGREAQNPGVDGALARATYLETEAAVATGDTAIAALMKRKTDLQAQVEALKARKDTLPADQYETELEKLLIELARVSQQLRTKT